MRRISIIGACLLAALAISVVATASASAAAPEFGRCIKKEKGTGGEGYSNAGCTTYVSSGAKYAWSAGPGPNNKFTAAARYVFSSKYKDCVSAMSEEEIAEADEKKAEESEEPLKKKYLEEAEEHRAKAVVDRGKAKLTKEECEKLIETEKAKAPAELETVTGDKVTCGGVSSEGEYTGPKSLVVTTTFTECITSELSLECSSPGAAAGEIDTSTLEGEPGITKEEITAEGTKLKGGVSLAAMPGADIAEFTCGSGIFKVEAKVTGSVIHEVKSNAMILEEVESFTQSKGKQKPEEPQQRPDITRAQIKPGKRRKQKRNENDRRKLVIVGHTAS